MCGIAGVYLRDTEAKGNLNKMLDTMLDCIEHRGGDATGFVAVGAEGVTEWQKAACGSKDFIHWRRPVPKGTRTFLAHTRWATLGLPVFVENNHPVKRGDFFVIHNGHVSNHDKLFELAGRKPYGQVDSESIPARFASLDSLAAAPKVMAEIEGAAAIAAVDQRKPGDLLLARGHSSPLFVLQTKRYVLWASTKSAIEKTYTEHIGALPRRQKIVSVPEGVALHYVDGKATRLKFKPYSPPKVVYADYKTTWPWKETSTEVAKYVPSNSIPSHDGMECDGCGEMTRWFDLDYQVDTDGHTWMFCKDCEPMDWSQYGIHKDAELEAFSDGAGGVWGRKVHSLTDGEWDRIEDED